MCIRDRRWVHQYSPEIEKKIRRHLRLTNYSWRVDETYIKVKGKWKYFYRAVDSNGDTIDFMLSAKRSRKAAKRFFKRALSFNHNQIPRLITVDKNPAYPSLSLIHILPAGMYLLSEMVTPIAADFGSSTHLFPTSALKTRV